MIFIDLAGNECARDINNGNSKKNNDETTHKLIIPEQRERTEINQSLLSLK